MKHKAVVIYWLVLVFQIVLKCDLSWAQEYPKLHFTVEDGLPSNTVYCCYRDSKGFMWLTTDKGVMRYNGVRFEVFNTFDGLPDNEIFIVQEDHQGRIWLGAYNGELCFYKDGIFHTAANTPFLRLPVKTQQTRHVILEADSSITILYTSGGFVNIKNETARYYEVKDYVYIAAERRQIFTIRKLNASTFRMFGVEKEEVITFKDTTHTVISSTKNFYFRDSCDESIGNREALGAQEQEYIVSSCFVYDMDWKVLYPLSNARKGYRLNQIYRRDNSWFFATDHGVLVNDSLQLFPGKNISCVTQDREGNYWFSTLKEGVFVLDKSYLNSSFSENVYNTTIKYAKVINGLLFFVDEKADVFIFDKGNGSRRCVFRFEDHFSKELKLFNPVFYIDSNYKLYCNSNRVAFTVENLQAKELKISRQFINLASYYSLKKMLLSGDNAVINAGFKVVSANFKNIGSRPLYYHVVGDILSPDKIIAYCQDMQGAIWYSTINGVFKVVNGVPVIQPQFKGIAFKSFIFVRDHLVGYTHNNALLFCSTSGSKIIVDTIVPESCVWDKLYEIDDQHLFITTDNWYRMLEVRKQNGRDIPIVTTVEKSFIPLHAEAVAFDNETGYFFKSHAITSVSLQQLYRKVSTPKIYFTTVTAAGKQLNASQQLELPYNDSRNLIISFAAVSFGGNKLFYQYSLSKGRKDNWVDLKEEQINVANPGYGRYAVKVRARTMSSNYSQPEIFELTILRPFWATWWFIAIVVVCVGCGIWYLVRRRVAIVLKIREDEHDNKVRFMRSEYKALNALMNPHFIFNTLNNVQSLVNRDDKRAANEYLRIFADLVRQNMHNVSNELIPLEKEMNLVSNYLLLEKLRFKENLHYRVDIDSNVDLTDIMVPPLLIQPLVENSIKHGIYPLESAEGMVIVRVYEKNEKLHIEIRDNGVGLAPDNKGTGDEHISFGLENIRRRIEQLSVILDKEITFDIYESQEETEKWTIAAIAMPN